MMVAAEHHFLPNMTKAPLSEQRDETVDILFKLLCYFQKDKK